MAEITLEQVERLREKADVTFEEAKAALESANGDLLDAVIFLERQGKTHSTSGGYYSTRGGGAVGPDLPPQAGPLPVKPVKPHKAKQAGKAAQAQFKDVFDAAWNVLRHSTLNQLEIWRGQDRMAAIPVLIVVLLAVVAFWLMVPLAVIALFCGCRYRFSGPDLGRESINRTMNKVSDTAEEIKRQVKHEMTGKHHK